MLTKTRYIQFIDSFDVPQQMPRHLRYLRRQLLQMETRCGRRRGAVSSREDGVRERKRRAAD